MMVVRRPRTARRRDLPSYREMREQLRGMGMLTRFVARQQRPELLRLTKQVADLAELVDRFYACLGERNWIFPGSLSVDDLRAILDRAESPAAAEEELIALYRAEGQLEFLAMRLRHRDGWRPRSHQIDRALEHYRAEQYDSCVLHLIAVMDGFVNDSAPGERTAAKGQQSRGKMQHLTALPHGCDARVEAMELNGVGSGTHDFCGFSQRYVDALAVRGGISLVIAEDWAYPQNCRNEFKAATNGSRRIRRSLKFVGRLP